MTVHMGYLAEQKGYILYDLENISFLVRRDVSFREDIFPFKQNQSTSTTIFTQNNSLHKLFYETSGQSSTTLNQRISETTENHDAASPESFVQPAEFNPEI